MFLLRLLRLSFIFLNIYFVASLIISGFPAQAQFCLDWPQNQSDKDREREGKREWEKSNKLSMSLFVIFVYATGASLYVDRYFSRYFHAGDGILSNLKLANNAFELVKLKVCRSFTPTPLPANYVRYYGQIFMSLSARGARWNTFTN